MVRPPIEPAAREPAINAPRVVVALLALLAGIHLIWTFASDQLKLQIILLFAFLPARYDPAVLQGEILPGGAGADVWTFLTYAFLHGSWAHLVFNGIWMLAFGSAVAWRFGTARFLLFSAVCSVAGAATHLAVHWGDEAVVIGASAAISGYMAAATRFMFQPGAPLGLFRIGGATAFRVPALPLREVLRDRRVLVFLVIWFAANLLTGLGTLSLGGEGPAIAWEAHVGGFLAGLVLFPLFDPVLPGDQPGPAIEAGPPPE